MLIVCQWPCVRPALSIARTLVPAIDLNRA